ncbi:MAG: hypothetical protein RSC55_00465 [Oscillospiraceae bacterium]
MMNHAPDRARVSQLVASDMQYFGSRIALPFIAGSTALIALVALLFSLFFYIGQSQEEQNYSYLLLTVLSLCAFVVSYILYRARTAREGLQYDNVMVFTIECFAISGVSGFAFLRTSWMWRFIEISPGQFNRYVRTVLSTCVAVSLLVALGYVLYAYMKADFQLPYTGWLYKFYTFVPISVLLFVAMGTRHSHVGNALGIATFTTVLYLSLILAFIVRFSAKLIMHRYLEESSSRYETFIKVKHHKPIKWTANTQTPEAVAFASAAEAVSSELADSAALIRENTEESLKPAAIEAEPAQPSTETLPSAEPAPAPSDATLETGDKSSRKDLRERKSPDFEISVSEDTPTEAAAISERAFAFVHKTVDAVKSLFERYSKPKPTLANVANDEDIASAVESLIGIPAETALDAELDSTSQAAAETATAHVAADNVPTQHEITAKEQEPNVHSIYKASKHDAAEKKSEPESAEDEREDGTLVEIGWFERIKSSIIDFITDMRTPIDGLFLSGSSDDEPESAQQSATESDIQSIPDSDAAGHEHSAIADESPALDEVPLPLMPSEKNPEIDTNIGEFTIGTGIPDAESSESIAHALQTPTEQADKETTDRRTIYKAKREVLPNERNLPQFFERHRTRVGSVKSDNELPPYTKPVPTGKSIGAHALHPLNRTTGDAAHDSPLADEVLNSALPENPGAETVSDSHSPGSVERAFTHPKQWLKNTVDNYKLKRERAAEEERSRREAEEEHIEAEADIIEDLDDAAPSVEMIDPKPEPAVENDLEDIMDENFTKASSFETPHADHKLVQIEDDIKTSISPQELGKREPIRAQVVRRTIVHRHSTSRRRPSPSKNSADKSDNK